MNKDTHLPPEEAQPVSNDYIAEEWHSFSEYEKVSPTVFEIYDFRC